MADIIGVLGEATSTDIGTYTAYTVPAGKASKVKVMYYGIAGANSTVQLKVNGIPLFTSGALTATQAVHTTTAAMVKTQAPASIDGLTDATTVGIGPKEYYLSAGDLVQYTIGTANMSSMNVQVVGTEISV